MQWLIKLFFFYFKNTLSTGKAIDLFLNKVSCSAITIMIAINSLQIYLTYLRRYFQITFITKTNTSTKPSHTVWHKDWSPVLYLDLLPRNRKSSQKVRTGLEFICLQIPHQALRHQVKCHASDSVPNEARAKSAVKLIPQKR